MKKFKDKYRIPSARAQWWDYSRDGVYFITICTGQREFYFGDIENGKMNLSNLGVLADVLWHEIPNHAKNVTLGEFKVMPNHIHGIIILDGNDNGNINNNDIPVETRHALSLPITQLPLSLPITQLPLSLPITQLPLSLPTIPPTEQTPGQKRFRNQGKNTASSIIGSYKSALSKHAHRLGYEFQWQSRFWDNIIFNQESFDRITEYIKTNAERWEMDKFHPNQYKPED